MRTKPRRSATVPCSRSREANARRSPGSASWGHGEGGGGEVPGVHGAETVLADERESVFLDLGLRHREDGDRSVGGEVGVEEREEPSRVGAAAAGGTDERPRDLDACPGARHGRDLGVVEECERLLVTVLAGEVRARMEESR